MNIDEINKLKDEVRSLNEKLSELTDEELLEVTGGQSMIPIIFASGKLSQIELIRYYQEQLAKNSEH